MFSRMVKPLGLPFGKPTPILREIEHKIAALLKPLGKTGLYGDCNRGKACSRKK